MIQEITNSWVYVSLRWKDNRQFLQLNWKSLNYGEVKWKHCWLETLFSCCWDFVTVWITIIILLFCSMLFVRKSWVRSISVWQILSPSPTKYQIIIILGIIILSWHENKRCSNNLPAALRMALSDGSSSQVHKKIFLAMEERIWSGSSQPDFEIKILGLPPFCQLCKRT